MSSTDEHAADLEARIKNDLGNVMTEHGLATDGDDCLLDCLTAAAMHHVEQLLTKVDWHDDLPLDEHIRNGL